MAVRVRVLVGFGLAVLRVAVGEAETDIDSDGVVVGVGAAEVGGGGIGTARVESVAWRPIKNQTRNSTITPIMVPSATARPTETPPSGRGALASGGSAELLDGGSAPFAEAGWGDWADEADRAEAVGPVPRAGGLASGTAAGDDADAGRAVGVACAPDEAPVPAALASDAPSWSP